MLDCESTFQKSLAPIVLLTVDGGSDVSPTSISVMFEMFRLWRSLDLDILIEAAPAPGASRQNTVERSWTVANDIMGPRTLPKAPTSTEILRSVSRGVLGRFSDLVRGG